MSEKTPDHRDDAFTDRLQEVLADALGHRVDLAWKEDLTNSPFSTCSRFQLSEGSASRTVVIKQFQPPYGEPDGPVSRLYDEYAALKFIGNCGLEGIGPAGIAIDPEQILLVQEDLGHVSAAVLQGDDPDGAERYLVDHVRTLGRLHAETAGKSESYDRLREDLGRVKRSHLTGVEYDDPGDIDSLLRKWWHAACETCETERNPACDSDLEEIAHTLLNPGPYHCLTHGDVSPGNELPVGNRIVLIDFENAAYRHALTDGAADPSIYQTAWLGYRIPAEVLERMRDAYRQELAKGCPDAADDDSFFAAVTAVSVFRSLYQLQRCVRPDVLTENKPFGSTTTWQRVIKALDAIVWVSSTYGLLTEIGEGALHMRTGLRKRWPSEFHESPVFPAFQ